MKVCFIPYFKVVLMQIRSTLLITRYHGEITMLKNASCDVKGIVNVDIFPTQNIRSKNANYQTHLLVRHMIQMQYPAQSTVLDSQFQVRILNKAC